MTTRYPIVVIGVGNEFRTDDGAGLYAARKIKEIGFEHVKVIEGVSDGTSLMEAWEKSTQVFVIDCAVSGAAPGIVYRFDTASDEIPRDLFSSYSTHAINVADTVELARILGTLPPHVVIYGIEGNNFAPGNTLSPVVKEKTEQVVENIILEIRQFLQKQRPQEK